MKADAQTYESADTAARHIAGRATENRERVGAADGGRAAQNISLWTSYLPPDCIRAMIAMGWDRTT
jgi:hypothetical protein